LFDSKQISQEFSIGFDRILFSQKIYKRKRKHIKEIKGKRKRKTIERRNLILLQFGRGLQTTSTYKILKMELECAVDNFGALFNKDGINEEVNN